MRNYGMKNPNTNLLDLGINKFKAAYWNLSPKELVAHTVQNRQGLLSNSGALVIYTGKFTGRSPKDRYIVKNNISKKTVDWNDINTPILPMYYEQLRTKLIHYLEDKDIYIRDAYACADENYRLSLRLVAEYPWSAMFANNMFLRPTTNEILNANPEWTILCAPGFKANPEIDGTRKSNFAIINFSRKEILIGGTGYTGEIKKGIFSVLNYLLPLERNVLSMHCSANVGKDEDVAVFFGLSGTGKTTLSADPNRKLIGDDEHGWSRDGVFNFEGGCYAKTINLSAENEPDIFHAIRPGAILENIKFFEGTNRPDYEDATITENTRVSYPIDHIDNIQPGSKGGIPKNIFFLTCDAFGVLPPVSKLTPNQAMYHFISGYTAKVAGTEADIVDPEMTFSACFGSPFLPLHPTFYAEMLKEKITEFGTNVWLINTGWSGGGFGVGNRVKLRYTREMISAALNGDLDNVAYEQDAIFGLSMPTTCPNVPTEILNPRNTWQNKTQYDEKAAFLANAFNKNFEKFESEASEAILSAAPKTLVY
ncbi:MAG: phosphoenolpyruvate carboxykinase (ATP) [Saprospiraceae bacterium]|nr:phosphoenolpyruvate carboxykinase (ATP) [Saprospiraceae bacterium]